MTLLNRVSQGFPSMTSVSRPGFDPVQATRLTIRVVEPRCTRETFTLSAARMEPF